MRIQTYLTVAVCLLMINLPFAFAGEMNLAYDANGNLVTGDGFYREYDGFNQLARIRNETAAGEILEEYIFHPIEERIAVKKVYNGGSLKETVFYHDKNFVTVVNASGRFEFTYVFHEGQLIAQKNPDGSKLFFHPDHLGSTTLITNESGSKVEETFYKPFGGILSGGSESRFDYEGKEFSSVVGDYDFNFRKYSPELGIFTQPDTLIPSVYDPQFLNRYSFERNNPYRYEDDDGHEPITIGTILLIVYLAWKIWGVALSLAPLLQKAKEGTLTAKDLVNALGIEATLSLLPIIGDFITFENTRALFKDQPDQPPDLIALLKDVGLDVPQVGQVAPSSNTASLGDVLNNLNLFKSKPKTSFTFINKRTGRTFGSGFSVGDLDKLKSGGTVKKDGSTFGLVDKPGGGQELLKVTPVGQD